MNRVLWIDPVRKGRYKAVVHFQDAEGTRRERWVDQKDLDILLDMWGFP